MLDSWSNVKLSQSAGGMVLESNDAVLHLIGVWTRLWLFLEASFYFTTVAVPLFTPTKGGESQT